MQEFWSTGVLTAKTRCWAQGMDGWRPLQAIPQLKWCLLATGQAVMNESDLATLILNMLITMCSYYPSRWGPHIMSVVVVVCFCAENGACFANLCVVFYNSCSLLYCKFYFEQQII